MLLCLNIGTGDEIKKRIFSKRSLVIAPSPHKNKLLNRALRFAHGEINKTIFHYVWSSSHSGRNIHLDTVDPMRTGYLQKFPLVMVSSSRLSKILSKNRVSKEMKYFFCHDCFRSRF